MKTNFFKLTIVLLVLSFFTFKPTMLSAQVLDYENRLGITLSDGTSITLYGKATPNSDVPTKDYYYLPTEPRLSFKSDGTPEFLFLKYVKNEKGEVSGALLHLIMKWGLTSAQQAEVEGILNEGKQSAKKGSVLKGAVDVMPDGDESFKVLSATLSDDKTKVITSSKAPTTAGSKIAIATHLNSDNAQLLSKTFEEGGSITDLSVQLSYKYTVRMRAAEGTVKVKWREMHKQMQKDSANYSRAIGTSSRSGLGGALADGVLGQKKYVKSISYDEMHEIVDKLIEKELIVFDWEESMVDERITVMREFFYEFFINKMTNSASQANPIPSATEEKEEIPDIKKRRNYTFNRSYLKSSFKRKDQVFKFKSRLAVEKPHTVLGNLASWYDAVRDNEKCVNTVILDEQFFQHRDITFEIDAYSKEIFEKGAINYVTVDIRKKRKSGNDFNKTITFDEKYVNENGFSGSITYARGADENSSKFEYKAQWSLPGGNLYPENPTFQEEDLASIITLSPPILPRKITFMADAQAMKDLGLIFASLQLRYYKFGKEFEKWVPLKIIKGEEEIIQTIYPDKDSQGYAYRVILTDKKNRKMVVTDWNANTIDDGFIYAAIPDELENNDTNFIEKALEEAENITKPKEGVNNVLDRFKDVIKIIK